MSGVYLTWLADAFRAAGLVVVEYSGWQTRARSSGGFTNGRPVCVMWHHTASQTTPTNDMNYMIFNSSSRPIANVGIARDGSVHVGAAGGTNTNGKGTAQTFSRGSVPADSMNLHAFGMEIMNNGVGEPYPQAQIDAAFIVSNVVNARVGNLPTDVMTHTGYAAGRKIDPATANAPRGPWQPRSINSSGSWNLDDLRAECSRRATTAPPNPQPDPGDDDDMRVIYAFRQYANTFSDTGVHLSPEAYAAMVAAGAIVVTSELTWPKNQHLDSLLAMSGLNADYLVPIE